VKIRVPETDLEKQLVNVAKTNARHAIEQAKKGSGGHGLAALEEIQEKLHLAKLPTRIECYDNSNILGEDAVASRVVFIDGAPDKNLYRRYKIRTVEGANDFATMREVLARRFSGSARGEQGEIEDLPDLVVVDGGKGQLSQAVAILEELSVQGVAVVGLAKARTESDFKAKEVESSLERIFIPGRKNPVPLLPHTKAYKLLTHVRDEAHRFAITYHRLLRDKRSLKTKASD
jgi:excinuclease ABC subunit C